MKLIEAWFLIHKEKLKAAWYAYKAFKALKDKENFKSVKISDLSIKWKNGADICPDELYNLSK